MPPFPFGSMFDNDTDNSIPSLSKSKRGGGKYGGWGERRYRGGGGVVDTEGVERASFNYLKHIF